MSDFRQNVVRLLATGIAQYQSYGPCHPRRYGDSSSARKHKDNVKTHRLKGRSKTRQEIYLAVQAAKRTAKDWISIQRELAQKGITVRKKLRRGSTDVEGLSYIKDGQKFKASQVDRDGRCSYDVICKALDRNKNSQAKQQPQAQKLAPSPIEKVVQVGAEVAENIGNALGGLFQVRPGYDPEEEAFLRQMKRRKKKKGRSL